MYKRQGHVTGYLGYSERKELLAGERDYAMQNANSIINTGGYYTDRASGNAFAIDASGGLVDERQTTSSTADLYLTQPMKRLSSGLLFDFDLSEDTTAYGRVMYSQVTVEGAGASGQAPISVNQEVTLTADNAFLSDEMRNRLTFDADGNAQVNVERNLGLGVQRTKAERDSIQMQMGIKGDINDYLRFDVYGQYGKTDETATLYNNAYTVDGAGNNRFAALALSLIHI